MISVHKLQTLKYLIVTQEWILHQLYPFLSLSALFPTGNYIIKIFGKIETHSSIYRHYKLTSHYFSFSRHQNAYPRCDFPTKVMLTYILKGTLNLPHWSVSEDNLVRLFKKLTLTITIPKMEPACNHFLGHWNHIFCVLITRICM